MREIQDVKKVFSYSAWKEHLEENPRRIYGFLLCADEHRDFCTFISNAWKTLHTLSGEACDIFTFEKSELPNERFHSQRYIPINGGSAGRARIASGEALGYQGRVCVDNGIMLPDRTQCFEVRDQLFENPTQIILPGFVLFPSARGENAFIMSALV